jgi:hypothetical protein
MTVHNITEFYIKWVVQNLSQNNLKISHHQYI